MKFITYLAVLCCLDLTVLFFICRSPILSPIHQTFSLTSAHETAKIQQSMRYILFLEIMILPFYILILGPSIQFTIISFLYLFVIGLAMGVGFSPVYVVNGVRHLSLTMSLSGSILCIHLYKAEQSFNRSTYRELGLVLNKAKNLHFDKIQMRSPLFCRQQSPRSFKIFEKIVAKHGYNISSRPLKWYESIPSKIELLRLKYCKLHPSPTIKKLDSCWYEVTLHRLS